MSAATPTLGARGTRSFGPIQSHAGATRVVTARPWVRLAAFGALAAYGIDRWATLMHPAPGWRLAGLLGLALLLAGVVPVIARRDRVIAGLTGAALIVLGLPMAGLRWQWFVHERITRSEHLIASGLSSLPGALVPYLGSSHAVRLVIVLGAAVLVLDAAAVLAFAPRTLSDGRRMAAALPLTALAVVPSTIVRPQLPYLQGLLLFVLLAAFMWGERIPRAALGSAVIVLAVAGVVGAIAAPRIDPRSPWINYRSWSAQPAIKHVDRFDWSQTYGPLRWPHRGHTVMAVDARAPEYWKTEDFDRFDGTGWALGVAPAAPLPQVTPAQAARWTQTIRVSIEAMNTQNVISAGYAASPGTVPGGAAPGSGAGTWIARQTLTPGTTYRIGVYTPHPSPAQLAADRVAYPPSLAAYRTMALPQPGEPATVDPTLTFPAFHSGAAIRVSSGGLQRGSPAQALRASPYGPVYALAHQLAATSSSPYAFIEAVKRYLGHGFRYDQNPRPSEFPLVSFLLDTRAGYCQQFAGAMALLLRMGGVPAHVATGFTSGTETALTNQFEVSDIDAHAWVEAWFPRYGWFLIDPTPVTAPARASTSTDTPITKGLAALAKGNPVHRREIGSSGLTTNILRRGAAGTGPSGWLLAAFVLAVIAAALIARAVVRYRRLDHDPFSELERALARTGRPLAGGVTLVELEHRLQATPDAAEYIRRLRAGRYGGQPVLPTRLQRRALRRELARGLGLRGGMRAWWALPPQPLRARRVAP